MDRGRFIKLRREHLKQKQLFRNEVCELYLREIPTAVIADEMRCNENAVVLILEDNGLIPAIRV